MGEHFSILKMQAAGVSKTSALIFTITSIISILHHGEDIIQGVSGGIVNILGGGSMDYSE